MGLNPAGKALPRQRANAEIHHHHINGIAVLGGHQPLLGFLGMAAGDQLQALVLHQRPQ